MLTFDGAIAGMGTASGTRLVVGMWPLSPYGSVTDVMIERDYSTNRGYGQSKLSNTAIEKVLGSATTRNWNTVTALLAMAEE